MKSCFETNAVINLAVLQVRLMPNGSGLPRPIAIPLHIPIQGLLPKLNRLPIVYYYYEDPYNSLNFIQCKILKNNDTLKENIILSAESEVAVKRKDSTPCTHSKFIEHGDGDHNESSYKVHFAKTQRIVAKNSRHMK